MAADNGFIPMAGGVWDTMEEDAAINGNFYAPEAGRVNQVLILTDPVRGMTEYKTQKEQRVQYQMLVAPIENGKPGEPKVWGVKAKSALQQILAIVKGNHINSLVGSVLQIVVAMKAGNNGSSFRDYTILPVELPSPQRITVVKATYPPSKLREIAPKVMEALEGQQPQAAPQRAPADPAGVAWVESQKVGS